MSVDVLLLLGACLVTLIIGLETGFTMAENKLPGSLSEMATALANLHESHGDAKAKIADAEKAKQSHAVKLYELINRITREYLLEEKST
jgi:hypothetical protein